MDYEKCYEFKADGERPTKKRRLESQGLHSTWPLRQAIYRKLWLKENLRIDNGISKLRGGVVSQVVTFLEQSFTSTSNLRIPTGFVLAAPNASLSAAIVDELDKSQTLDGRIISVKLASQDATNLKAALKAIITRATTVQIDDEDDDELETTASTRKGRKLLSYDLQVLYDHLKETRRSRVLISFEDTEAFDSDVLSELIEVLACWKDRISLAFIFTIATSVDFLQQRLSKHAIKCIRGQIFDAVLSTAEVECVISSIFSASTPLWLGSSLLSMLLERQSDYIQNADSLIDEIQYAYMSHFYANALSIFLEPSVKISSVPKDHFEALRNLPSFQTYAENLLKTNTKSLELVLDSDRELFKAAHTAVADGRKTLQDILIAANIIGNIQAALNGQVHLATSTLYVQAMSAKLVGSPMLRTMLLSLRKAPSDVALSVLNAIFSTEGLPDRLRSSLKEVSDDLGELIDTLDPTSQPLRSGEDAANSTFRTTIVAKKVALSKSKSALSREDTAYTTLLQRLSSLLEDFFADTLIDPRSLFLHETFIYDLKSPHREVFMPRLRHAIERALAAPHDYLDCSCCAPEGPDEYDAEATLAASQPATALVYQLYLESGNLINVSDLWQAFQAVIGDTEMNEQQTTALFQRALAELRYFGFVKASRKKADHVAKVAWRGL